MTHKDFPHFFLVEPVFFRVFTRCQHGFQFSEVQKLFLYEMHFGKEAYYSSLASSLGFVRSFVSSLLNSRSSAVFHVADCGQITWQSFNSKSLTALHIPFSDSSSHSYWKNIWCSFVMEKRGWSSWDFRVAMSIYVRQLPKSLFNWWETHTLKKREDWRNKEIMMLALYSVILWIQLIFCIVSIDINGLLNVARAACFTWSRHLFPLPMMDYE